MTIHECVPPDPTVDGFWWVIDREGALHVWRWDAYGDWSDEPGYWVRGTELDYPARVVGPAVPPAPLPPENAP